MGIPILPELIDFEIRDIVNEHINEAFDFLQTSGCCSGWSGDPEVVNGAGQPSDGVNGV